MPVIDNIIVPDLDFEKTIAEAFGYDEPYDCGLICSNQYVSGYDSNNNPIISKGYTAMWAKYKPVFGGGPGDQCQYPNEPNYKPDLWKGRIVQNVDRYHIENGIGIPVMESLSDSNKHYVYFPPVLNSDWMRITDFDKHFVEAIHPFDVYMPEKLNVAVGSSFVVSISDRTYNLNNPEVNLKATDFEYLKDKYFVLFLYNATTKFGRTYVNRENTVGNYIVEENGLSITLPYNEMSNWIKNGDTVNAYLWLTEHPDNPTSGRCSCKITEYSVTNRTYYIQSPIPMFYGYYQYSNLNLGRYIYVERTSFFKGMDIYDDEGNIHTDVQYGLTFNNWAARAYTDLPPGRRVNIRFVIHTDIPYNGEGDFVNPAIPRVVLYETNESSSGDVRINSATAIYDYTYPGNPNLTGNWIPVFGLYPIRVTIEVYSAGSLMYPKPIASETIIDLNDIKNW